MPTIQDVAADIRRTMGGNFDDLDYLAQLFEDSSVASTAAGNELQSRLVTIFEASTDGTSGGVTHFGGILGGCKDRGFRDDFKDGSNQVGHFLTAVDMGYRPDKTGDYAREVGLKPWEEPGKAGQMWEWARSEHTQIDIPWNQKFCISLIIRHEQIPDLGGNWQWLSNAASALTRADDDEVYAFLAAVRHVSLTNADLRVTKAALSSIHVGSGAGNSIMDLHLSLYGYALGRFIKYGNMTTRHDAAKWIRWNIGGTFAFTQRT